MGPDARTPPRGLLVWREMRYERKIASTKALLASPEAHTLSLYEISRARADLEVLQAALDLVRAQLAGEEASRVDEFEQAFARRDRAYALRWLTRCRDWTRVRVSVRGPVLVRCRERRERRTRAASRSPGGGQSDLPDGDGDPEPIVAGAAR